MSDFDHAAAFATQAEPDVVVGRLLAGREALRFRDWYSTRAIPMPGGPKRTPDLVAILGPPGAPDRPSLMIFEFQSEHDEQKLDTTFLEVAVFRNYARHGEGNRGKFRVLCGLVYLKGECPETVLDMTLSSGHGTRHEPLLWEVGKSDAAAALDAVAEGREGWGLLFWVPLMTGADQPGIIARWRELVQQKVSSGWMRENVAGVALAFAELAGRFLAWDHALEGWQMGESQVVNRWRAQGEVRAWRQAVLDLLRSKYTTSVTDEVVQMVEQQSDLDLLRRWFTTALGKGTFAEFVGALK
jgi:hypothetical protein